MIAGFSAGSGPTAAAYPDSKFEIKSSFYFNCRFAYEVASVIYIMAASHILPTFYTSSVHSGNN